jgi:vacuolar-type H+-ATPase subunit C/Vma6
MAGRDYVLARLGGARAGLLDAAGLEDLLSRPDAAGRLEVLRASVWRAAAGSGPGPDDVEGALSRVARREAGRVLDEIDARSRRMLAAFLLADDARALKGALRAVSRALPAERAAAMLEPSTSLDLAALRELAASADGPALAGALEARGSPFAAAVRAHAAELRKPGALLRAEVALDAAAAAALRRRARGPGQDRGVLRRLAALRADLANAATLLAAGGEPEADGLWLEGGERLGAETFRALAALASRRLAEALATRLEPVLGPRARTAPLLASPLVADHLLGRALVRAARREARRAPLSLAVPCAWLLDLGEEVRRVRLVLRATDLGYPPAGLLDLLEA